MRDSISKLLKFLILRFQVTDEFLTLMFDAFPICDILNGAINSNQLVLLFIPDGMGITFYPTDRAILPYRAYFGNNLLITSQHVHITGILFNVIRVKIGRA